MRKELVIVIFGILSDKPQVVFQEYRDVMVHNSRFYVMKDEIAVLSIGNLTETVADRNLWSACNKHLQPDLLQRLSLSQES